MSGCSMSPMYGENSGSSAVMKNIDIVQVRNREHQIIRNELLKYIDGNTSSTKKTLELDFNVDVSRSGLLFTSTGEAQRMQIDVEVTYGIFRITEFRELIYSDKVRVINTYTLSQSEYNNAQADISTFNLISKEIASNINRQISLNYLNLVE
jgi:hypothetical protein